jgi:hypothetical protein
MKIAPKYKIGQVCYVKTDVRQYPWMVVAYRVTATAIIYCVVNGTSAESTHYDFELSSERDIVLSTTGFD